MPRGNQGQVAKVIQDHGLSSQQSAKLVARWLDAAGEASREAVLSAPVQKEPALATAAASARRSTVDPRLGSIGAAIWESTVRASRAVIELTERLTFHPPAVIAAVEVGIVHELLAAVSVRLMETEEAVRAWRDAVLVAEAADV